MPDFSDTLFSLLVATALSGLVGLEREMRAQKEGFSGKNLGGLRTFAMMGALGFCAGFFSEKFNNPHFLLFLFFATTLSSFISHGVVAISQKRFGMTSELSLLASFLIGVFVAFGELYLAIAISVLFTGLLALKEGLHGIAQKMDSFELIAVLKFLILSAVILPILPKSLVDPFGFFDWRPQTVWMMVVLVASIRFLGYFLGKIFGAEKSILLSGIVGGFASSTAVTTGIAQESKNQKEWRLFLVPILFASAIMFFRVIFEAFIVGSSSRDFVMALFVPLGFMGVFSALLGVFFLFRKSKTSQKIRSPIKIDQPLQLSLALSFGVFFLGILLLSEKIPDFFPQTGLLMTGAIAGLSDVDAITLAMANLVKNGEISPKIAAEVVLLAVAVNTLIKVFLVFLFGSLALFRAVGIATAVLLLLGMMIFTGL